MGRISKYFRPAIGGLIVGLIAIEYPEILGLGYGWVQLIFFNNLALLWNCLITPYCGLSTCIYTYGECFRHF